MRKTILAVAALMVYVTARATVTTSVDGGTSYVHLGTLSVGACKSLVASPVVAGIKIAIDGHVMSADDAVCHAGAKN
jgi:hypothetical protein